MPLHIQETNPTDIPSAIKAKLSGLGISISAIREPIPGPIVTAYPIVLSASTPLSKLLSKAEDLALACGVESVDLRREGREVLVYIPNEERKVVKFDEALLWYLQSEEVKSMEIPLLLGMDSKGNNSVIELVKQPHLLIAGATGSGKSIFEANLIASLAMLRSERALHLYLVDTKLLDLPLFSSLPHVQDVAKTAEDFYSLIAMLNGEVEHRNKKLAKSGVRNVREYNLVASEKLPYIILIIDELADLIDKDKANRAALAPKDRDVEPTVIQSLKRLAAISRASGIHIIACTQRTSGDVLPGVLKNNFPARISLKVPTRKDSEYILDEYGAENLLGRGDMLVKEVDSDNPKRYHAPFVSLDDIRVVIEQIDRIKESMGMEV